jgi:hypothetical protein
MVEKVGKFTITVPEGHEQAGQKIDKAFTYQECQTDEEATQVLADKKLSIREMVNDKLKLNSRSNAYQAALLPYQPPKVSEEDIKERMVRDYIRLGKSEAVARKLVDAALSAMDAVDE